MKLSNLLIFGGIAAAGYFLFIKKSPVTAPADAASDSAAEDSGGGGGGGSMESPSGEPINGIPAMISPLSSPTQTVPHGLLKNMGASISAAAPKSLMNDSNAFSVVNKPTTNTPTNKLNTSNAILTSTIKTGAITDRNTSSVLNKQITGIKTPTLSIYKPKSKLKGTTLDSSQYHSFVDESWYDQNNEFFNY